MDKNTLNHLENLEDKLSGVAEKGFDIYTHGIFVQYSTYFILSCIVFLLFIALIVFICTKIYKAKKYGIKTIFYDFYENEKSAKAEFYLIISFLIVVVSIGGIIISLQGVLSPEYLAIRELLGKK